LQPVKYQTCFLSASALAEFQSYYRADDIVAKVLNWSFGFFEVTNSPYKVSIPFDLSKEARAAILQTNHALARDALVKFLTNDDYDVFTFSYVVETLARLERDDERIIHSLLGVVFEEDEDLIEIAEWSEEVFEEIYQNDKKAINYLENLIDESSNEHFFLKAAKILGKIDTGNQKAIDTLIESMFNSTDGDICLDALYNLGEIGNGNCQAISALEEFLLISDNDHILIEAAASSLREIDPYNQKALDTLINLIDIDSTRHIAVISLGKTRKDIKRVIDVLVDLICKSINDSICVDAARVLGEVGKHNRKAIFALMNLIDNSSMDYIRSCAARYLWEIDPGNQKAITTFEEFLDPSSTPKVYIRMHSAATLYKVNQGDQRAISILNSLLDTSSDAHFRKSAAQILGEVDRGNKKAVDTLVELIATSNNVIAASDVEKYAYYNPSKALIEIIQVDHMAEVVIALKSYLLDWNGADKNEAERFSNCYSVIWHCAHNLTYPEFYRAWNSEEITSQ
jgi:HEAT repeat protein